MRAMVWFRRDLRVHDNSALHHACKAANEGVVAVYTITPDQWKQHDDAPAKVSFWRRNLESLRDALSVLQIPLQIIEANTFNDVPTKIAAFAAKHNCAELFLNREYEVNEVRRDDETESACEKLNISVHRFHDRVIIPPDEIFTNEGKLYKVFTPYRRVWDERMDDYADCFPKPRKQVETTIESSSLPDSIAGFDESNARADLWPAGENEASKRLRDFIKRIADYDDARDVPSINGTSTLSPYLAAGVISPRQCLQAALDASDGDLASNPGAETWVSELTWRDFYTAVMVGYPRVSKHQPFKLKTRDINWRDSESDFKAWCDGRTGYPIVDAGMRQLNRTGWMHNRIRMIVAMFLTKHLLIDWRWGERYFMERLIDGDLAANNGGWQWSASTGTDAVPYFRIFNPFSQSKRYDKDGKYIKKFCPELEPIKSAALHDEKKLTKALSELNVDYPKYIVDYSKGRQRALEEFKRVG